VGSELFSSLAKLLATTIYCGDVGLEDPLTTLSVVMCFCLLTNHGWSCIHSPTNSFTPQEATIQTWWKMSSKLNQLIFLIWEQINLVPIGQLNLSNHSQPVCFVLK